MKGARRFLPGQQEAAASAAGLDLRDMFPAGFDRKTADAELHDARMRAIGLVILPYLRGQCRDGWPGHGEQYRQTMTNALADLEREVHDHEAKRAARVIPFPTLPEGA